VRPVSKGLSPHISPIASRFSRDDFLGAVSAGLLVVFFCLILLWHNPLVFWNDDYELSVLPVFADMVRSWSEGHWPILSPYSWVCGNLAGEFQYGVFSVFVNAVIIAVWKFPFTFAQQAAAVSMVHLVALAVGAFLLGRDRQFSIPLSIFVALVATLSGWIICWGATDWFGALGAFTWLPWTWWGAARALDARRSKLRFLWPAPFVYLVVTGGFPYTVLMLLLLVAWLTIKSLTETRSIFSVVPMLFGVALGFGLSTPAWLAILDLVQGSARELQPAKAHWQWLVPPAALPGLILPWWTVNWADFSNRYLPHSAIELASGLVAPSALLAGLASRGRALISKIKWELVLLLLVLFLAMVPTAGLFRWSFRWLPFFHLVLAVCAAEVLHLRPRSPAPAITALSLTVLTAIAMSFLRTTGSHAFPLTWIFLGLAAIWCVLDIVFRDYRFQKWTPPAITFSALLATYIFIPTNCGVPTYNFSQELLRQKWTAPAITFSALLATYIFIPTNCGVPTYNFSQELLRPTPLDPARLYLSIYPWAELTYCVSNKPQPVGEVLRPGSTSMWAGLRFINGYSPIRAAGVAREFATSIHGEINPDVGSNLLNHQAGKGGQLDLLGVDGIVVARELDLTPQPASDWELVLSKDEGRVFHRRGVPFQLVRSITSIDSRPGEEFATATVSRITDLRNSVEADVEMPKRDRPAMLTFSKPYFRGYTARLNHRKLKVTSYRGLFPMVEVPPNSHGQLTLYYRPAWLIWGAATVAVCVLVIMLALILRLRPSN
jgi:hypothetical protein